jgi:hypothetical protein
MQVAYTLPLAPRHKLRYCKYADFRPGGHLEGPAGVFLQRIGGVPGRLFDGDGLVKLIQPGVTLVLLAEFFQFNYSF